MKPFWHTGVKINYTYKKKKRLMTIFTLSRKFVKELNVTNDNEILT